MFKVEVVIIHCIHCIWQFSIWCSEVGISYFSWLVSQTFFKFFSPCHSFLIGVHHFIKLLSRTKEHFSYFHSTFKSIAASSFCRCRLPPAVWRVFRLVLPRALSFHDRILPQTRAHSHLLTKKAETRIQTDDPCIASTQ